jgi:4-hydroxybenzoate polyprenyltransferase
VDPHPSWSFLIILFLWLFFWEIGGQNIPNDWGDLDEDKGFQDKSVPLQFGARWANAAILGSLLLAVALNILVLRMAPLELEWPYSLICLLVGIAFLLAPAYRLYKSKDPLDALTLFNRASYYPLALLTVVGIRLIT